MLLVVRVLGFDVQAVWFVLCFDLFLRRVLMFARFRFGAWDRAKV